MQHGSRDQTQLCRVEWDSGADVSDGTLTNMFYWQEKICFRNVYVK